MRSTNKSKHYEFFNWHMMCGSRQLTGSHGTSFPTRSCKVKTCEESETVKQVLDRIVSPLLTARKNIGLAVGVIAHDQRHIFGYGTLSNARMDPIDGTTLFEIGSVTKVFTSMLLAGATE